jgi:hypothetical protein
MPSLIRQTTEIACSPAELYAYLSQPWLWHEWHPNSLSARANVNNLNVGDHFEEQIALQPFSPLPITLRRATRYQVLQAKPGQLWEVRGQMRDGWLQIRYEFVPVKQGTLFTRSLSYSASGISRLLMPLLRSRMQKMSGIALANLQARYTNAAQ